MGTPATGSFCRRVQRALSARCGAVQTANPDAMSVWLHVSKRRLDASVPSCSADANSTSKALVVGLTMQTAVVIVFCLARPASE